MKAVLEQAEAYRRAEQFAQGQAVLKATREKTADPTVQKKLEAALADLHRAWGDQLEQQYIHAKAIAHYETAIALDQVHRPQEAARTLTALGEVYYNTSHYDTAIEHYNQGLAIQQEIFDRQGEGRTLSKLGEASIDLSHLPQARDSLEQALTIQRAIQDRLGEGRTLGFLGDVVTDLSDYETAKTSYQQALSIAREVQDRFREGWALHNLGGMYARQSQYDKAMQFYEQALVIRREVGDRKGEGITLDALGNVYRSLTIPRRRTYRDATVKCRLITKCYFHKKI